MFRLAPTAWMSFVAAGLRPAVHPLSMAAWAAIYPEANKKYRIASSRIGRNLGALRGRFMLLLGA